MAGRQIRAAIVGAGTLLGKELAEELNNSGAATWTTILLDESTDAEAQLTATGDEPVLIQPLSADALDRCDIVFFAGSAETTREYWRRASGESATIVDLSGALEHEPGFSVRCPWLPGGTKPDLATLGIVAPHPAALMLALAADRLNRLELQSISATVLEPASQAGKAGLDELHQQTVSLLSFQSVPTEIFGTQVAFNLQTALGDEAPVRLDATRDIVRRHLRALLPGSLASAVTFQLVQAPVFHGYTISALAMLDRSVPDAELRQALNGGVVVAEDDTTPSNVAAAEAGDMLINVRAEGESRTTKGHWLWMASDNLRLAARGAVAAAMELAALRPTDRVQ